MSEKRVPYEIPFPGLADVEVPTAHAVALTDDRIVASYFRTQAPIAAQQADTAPDGGKRGTRARKRERTNEVQKADHTTHEAPSALAGAQSLAAIMQLEAPSRGTLLDLYNLIEACNIYLATEVINNAPDYMEPALANAPLLAVRASYAIALLAQCRLHLQPPFRLRKLEFARACGFKL